jgi:cobyrinic acid a,c-diamide synthase
VNAPRILVAGLSGGGGKTLVSVGLTAAWTRRGRTVAAFKKGPDYIDAAWLSQAAGRPCRNLDLFLMSPEAITGSLAGAAGAADVAVVEGNRGLFDGADARGSFSTAELSKLLATPVVLVVDATKCTRTAAALVLGCQRLDRRVPLRGVILNRTAGARHVAVLREAIEDACGVPVLGALPKLERDPFPERHLGLVPPVESEDGQGAVERSASLVEEHLDLDALWRVAHDAPPLEAHASPEAWARPDGSSEIARIGVFRDAAFQFYYPENLEALEREGAALTWISPLADAALPDVDALYIGGGFPETFADRLAANTHFRESLRQAVEDGLPVYAECGGAVYLGEKLLMHERQIPMSAAVPAVYGFGDRLDGHGYTTLETVKPNPFYPVSTALKGHEFHYTFLRSVIAEHVTFAFRVHKGHGFDGHRDGLCYRNVLASYTHVHALGTEEWAPSLVRVAARRRAHLLPLAQARVPGDSGV